MATRGAGTVAIIPARYASTRFPGKALAAETGKPLIQHVYEAAAGCAALDRVLVATDDERIVDAVQRFEGHVVLTASEHANGASRVAEAAEILGLNDDAIVVNVQGDEPELDPALIDAAVEALRESGAPMGTVASPFAPGEDPIDPNIVKVVRRMDGTALYFSRALIPHSTQAGDEAAPLKHVGLYAYRRSFLRTYADLPPTPLERTERLEQLRALEHGHAIAVAVREAHHHGIDTPEQYADFVARWKAG